MYNENVATTLKSLSEILIEAYTATTSPEITIPLEVFDANKHVVVGEAPIYLQYIIKAHMQISKKLHTLDEQLGSYLSENFDEELSSENSLDEGEFLVLSHSFCLLFNIILALTVEIYPDIKNKEILVLEDWMIAYDKNDTLHEDFMRNIKKSISSARAQLNNKDRRKLH